MTGRMASSSFNTPLRKPFVSTVTGGESKSRGVGNRLTNTGHGLLFEKRKNKINHAEKIRSSTQMKKLASPAQMLRQERIDDEEKKLILQNAGKVNLNRTVNVDSYLASQL